MSVLEDKFIELWEMNFNHIDLHREFMFAKPLGRKYRADFASIEGKVIIEIQGGIYGKGGHSSIAGIKRDCEKFSTMAQLGYLCFPLYGDMINIPQLKIIADTIVARCPINKPVSNYDAIAKQAKISMQKMMSVI